MSEATDRLRVRRTALIGRSELQRRELQDHARRIGTAVDSADRGLRMVRKLATPPVLVAAGLATALLLGRGRARQAFAAGLTVLGLVLRVRSVGQLLAGFASDRGSSQAVSRSR